MRHLLVTASDDKDYEFELSSQEIGKFARTQPQTKAAGDRTEL